MRDVGGNTGSETDIEEAERRDEGVVLEKKRELETIQWEGA